MKYSHLFNSNKHVYLRLQSVIHCTENSIYDGYVLGKSSANCLIEIIKTIDPRKILVINCKRVTEYGDHIFNVINEKTKSQKRTILLFNTSGIFDVLNQLLSAAGFEKEEYPSEGAIVINRVKDKPFYLKVIDECLNEEKEFLTDAITNSFYEYGNQEGTLPSTPIIAEGEFDANKIISNPKEFLTLTQLMADQVEELISQELNSKKFAENYRQIKLLAVSLRGAPIAAQIAMLVGRRFDLIDHLGPRHKLFDVDFFENAANEIYYIYIGDFAIGGTEVKIAKSYAQMVDCTLEYAFVIGSLFDKSRFRSFTLNYLVNITDLTESEYKLN